MAGSVGFVGLGDMGGPMAFNLVKAGFELVVHDINPARLDAAGRGRRDRRDSPGGGGPSAIARSAWSRPPLRPKP